ncbi:hypothetical protein TL16_g11449 [Triparma laevis f. inornata]|uniref:Uncharacterized protein n=1 Tax=Triparma laevis f. inornata TaxID=1714386 RepID=A0A9W7BIZ3_9STRA|nr:hypothetical protein TL16_g11449 [Triparma laevis f. inornata]
MMYKSIASESNEDHQNCKKGGKMGEEDEGDEDEEESIEVPPAESLSISMVVSTAPATTDQFMHTHEFRRHFVEFVHLQTLMALRVATKGFNAAADAFINEGVRSGELMVHSGKDISSTTAWAREERLKLVMRVILLLNIRNVGAYVCYCADKLVIVDIPEDVERIGSGAFQHCSSLTIVSLPTMLTTISVSAF